MTDADFIFRVASRWQATEQIGEGCFGQVFRGHDRGSGQQVAIKMEDRHSDAAGSLKIERDVLLQMADPVLVQGFAELFHFGNIKSGTVLVMELLGRSLADSVEAADGKLDTKSTVLVAEQVLCRIEYLHSKGVIHRDVKPENFMWGRDRKVHHLYLIDFGLVGRYWSKNQHVPMRSHQGLVGTARYTSINVHKGFSQSRRDDCEAIAHMLAFCLRGRLPWSGLKVKDDRDRNKMIGEVKAATDIDELFEGFPSEFPSYLGYCRRLEYSARPDYEQMLYMFSKLRKRLGVVEDHHLSWLRHQKINVKNLVPLERHKNIVQPDDFPRRSEQAKGRRFKKTPPPMDTE